MFSRTTRLLPILLCCVFSFAQGDSPSVSPQARRIHDSAIVIDTHADTPQRFLDENFDIGSVTPTTKGNIDLEKARAGNLGAEFFSIWVDPRSNGGHYAKRAFDLIDSVYAQASRHPNQMVMAYTAQDIVRARSGSQKKFAALMGVEGGHAIEDDLHILRDFYRLGVRYMTLTWSNTNEWADSSGDIKNPEVKHHDGLTDFGRQVVREMNHLGMMVDISHVSDKTFWDTIAVTKAPVIASHSSARALCDHARNMTDDMLKAVAKNGGVVNVNFYSAFVDDNFRKAEQEMAKDRQAAENAFLQRLKEEGKPFSYPEFDQLEREWNAKIPRPPLKSLIDQIDHIAKVAGVDHVGLGSDFDGVSGALPAGIDSAADLPKITQGLLDRGYSSADIKKMVGGNMLRVFGEVEQVSRKMQAEEPAKN
ncbi:MAG TPA: dipeptidase [Terriglobales bacterium]|nr:dipeptidase [Terriglobales bacterium]